MENKTNKVASKYLGKKVSSDSPYNPEFLVAIPRCENRKQYDIKENDLPFEGWDVWHAYEFSTITQNGLPVTRLIKLRYNCKSEFIVESKSLKLYLNSFNMTPFGKDTSDCLSICKKTIEKDLSNTLKTKVELAYIENNATRENIFQSFKDITKMVNEYEIKIQKFKEAPEVLKYAITPKTMEYKLTFDSLRSNCRVTHQPDFGDIFIYYKSKKHISEQSLIEYLASFRSEYHFHEECTEMIFKRLYDILDTNDKLLVTALYTRRGGIDICPVRYSKNCETIEVDKLIDITTFARNGVKQ